MTSPQVPHGAQLLVEIARSQIGQHEVPKGSNSGTQVRLYQAATSLGGTGWPWCAAFVSWVVQTAVRTQPAFFPSHFVVPREAGAWALADKWSKAAGCRVLGAESKPQIGDVVVFNFSGQGHCGIVVALRGDGSFDCVEGNTDENGGREGWQVATRQRRTVRNFVRIPFAA